MEQIIYGGIRVQLLSEDVVRIEAARKGTFCDQDTFFIPDRSQYAGTKTAYTVEENVICFGDSNTYGWMGSLDGATRRYPSSIRWTGRLARMLGPRWEVLEEGLGGRTLHDNFTVGNGMTDPFAVETFKELFIPKGWTVL